MSTVALYRTKEGRDEPFYVPSFLVEAGPSLGELKPLRDITRVSYKDSINQIDSFDLTLDNRNWAPNLIRYSGRLPGSTADERYSPMVVLPGTWARLWMGYATELGLFPMLTGRVTSVTPNFVPGQNTLTVRALSELQALRAAPKRVSWSNSGGRKITDSEIVRKIAQKPEYKIRAIIPPGLQEASWDSVLQTNETDIAFVVRLARREGYVVSFRESLPERSVRSPAQASGTPRKSLYFGPSDLLTDQQVEQMGGRAERFELAWGRSLSEFKPTLAISTNLWSQVSLSFWDRRTKQKSKLGYDLDKLWSAERSVNSDLKPLLPLDALGTNEVSGVPVSTRDQAMQLLRNTLRENFLQLLTVDGATVGHPELRACTRVEVTGVGKPFSGTYFVTGTTHTIDDQGYRTQFSARREQVRGAA